MMAKDKNKPSKKQKQDAQSLLAEMEAMPTMKMQRLGNGMTLGVEQNSVWVYFKVPTGPVADAKDTGQLETAYRPMFTMFNEIAKATPVGAIKKRSVSKSAYRHVHLLRINVPSLWKANDTTAPADRYQSQNRLNRFLYEEFPPKIVNESILCFGVKLEAKTAGSGLRQAWDSILFTLVEGGTPLIDYLADLDKVKAMASRAGLTELADKEVRKLDSWWNSGKNPDVVTLTHPDHMHLFSDHRSVRAAQHAGPADCEDWSDDMPGHRIISFGSLEDLEVEFEDPYKPAANWLLPALQAGALAISVRGQIEPQKLTREAIRTNRRQYLSDIQERQQQGKLSRAEEEERYHELTEVEGEYGAGGGSPTLMNASVLAAFDGQIEDFEVIDRGLASWLPMEFRQDKAWAEMMIASVRRANPNLLDMPVQNIAASGINSVSKVGDRYGVLRGFTETDKVPSYYSLESAYGDADRSPTSVVVASSGSGKEQCLSTRLPITSGWTTIGDLKVGDEVLGRDGKPYTVRSIHDQDNPDSYLVTLSDGQQIKAGGNHQWVVSDFTERRAPRQADHIAAQANRERTLAQVEELRALADDMGDEMVTNEGLASLLAERTTIDRWPNRASIRAALRMVDIDPDEVRQDEREEFIEGFTQQNYVTLYPVREFLQASIDGWSKRINEHREVVEHWCQAVDEVFGELAEVDRVSPKQVAPMLAEALGRSTESLKGTIREVAAESGVEHTPARPPAHAAKYDRAQLHEALMKHEPKLHGYPLRPDMVNAAQKLLADPPAEKSFPREIARWMNDTAGTEDGNLFARMTEYAQAAGLKGERVKGEVIHEGRMRQALLSPKGYYKADRALHGLADRLVQIQGDRGIAKGIEERVLSTSEMLAEGLYTHNGGANFAIHIPEAIKGVKRDLPIDPYVLGAWLGDGSTAQGVISSDPNSDDQNHMIANIRHAGYDDASTPWENPVAIHVGGLRADLREAGVLGKKHIPVEYLRVGVDQRLSVLQGLMDTDGTIDINGSCELSLSDERLARDSLELIRSLGIKASWSISSSGYRNDDDEYVACKDRHRIRFTTARKVFRLPRKAECLPAEEDLRATHEWLYVESIEPIASVPMRCITVNSPDHTYLVEDFVPTHNTMLLQWEAYQTAMLGYEQICVDPKAGSDLTAVFGAIPGAQIFSLDELAKADGAFDPLTYSETPEIGIPFAIDTIRKADPYSHPERSGQMEPDLAHALTWAVNNGATATLQALRMANDANEFLDDHMKAIERLAGSYAAFRALCGSGESGNALGGHKGTTLIKVGDGGLKLPTPGNPPQSQMERINITLVKNVVFAATAALNHRKGVLRLDEAWVFTANDPEGLDQLARLARSQTIDITLYTQKISDALDIGLDNYISRGAIMHIAEEAEAIAACKLMKIEPTPERLERITSTGMLGDDEGTPDANSLKPLKVVDPETGKDKVIRGSIAYYMDINSRVVPVEIDIPPRFAKIASTNIDDIEARKEAQHADA